MSLLVELDDFHNCLWVLLLLAARDAALLEELLPFLREACELASGRVEAYMGQMHRIVGSADLQALVRGEQVRHEAQHALFGFDGGRAARASRARRDGIWGAQRGLEL